jgi:hypothetical protein
MNRTPVEMIFAKASLTRNFGTFRAIRVGINSFMKNEGIGLPWSGLFKAVLNLIQSPLLLLSFFFHHFYHHCFWGGRGHLL